MHLHFVLLSILTLTSPALWAQIKKQFAVEDSKSAQLVKINMKTNTGNCFIRPSQSHEVLSVYSNQDLETYAYSFNHELKGKTIEVTLNFEENRSAGLSKSISYRMLGSRPTEDMSETFWKMYLNDAKPYHLELSYGMGNANIDLSGLAVKNLKIISGSADVHVGYFSDLQNKVQMDTMMVKVDLGSIVVKKLNLTRSKYVMAEVGFGNMLLDFSDAPEMSKEIKGRVGAGNLTIILPTEETPVKVHITESWLCKVNMLQSYKKIGTNTYVNAAYKKDAPNLVSFDLDVSMGNIIFKEKNNN
ncbi:MAG TPA: hypothetical protein PKC24_07450 [Cyclobacteriaceae bacterium]|nr:hypothetical protein [Cyclobacteriaceae bacterium]